MKIKKRSWFIHLLGLLALVIVFGVIFAGCDASTISIGAGLILGGIIGGSLGHVFIGIILGGIIGFVGLIIFYAITSPRSSSSSSFIGKKQETAMDRSEFILAKDCEVIKPEFRITCCNSLMFCKNDYDQVNCEKYGFRSEYRNYVNIFQQGMMDCFNFKRDGKCCLSKYM